MRNARMALALAAALFLVAAGQAWGQQTPPPTQGHQHGQERQAGKPGAMTMDCQQMMQARQRVMDEMKAMDGRLDELVQKMKSASGQAKVDATAAVVSEMVEQRKAMRETMETMRSRMMQHMGEHMAAGGDSLMKCPMMMKK